MFRAVLIGSVLLAGPADAEDWRVLNGAGITQALSARVLGYEDGSQQDFKADGTTLFEKGAARQGQWAVRADRYCSVWPPSDVWACYGVAARGIEIRFLAADASETVGRYIDLN